MLQAHTFFFKNVTSSPLQRLSAVSRELEFCDGEGNVDFVLVNDDLEEAYKGLKGYVREFVEK